MNSGDTVSPNKGETLTCVRSARDGGRFVYDLELVAGFGDSPPMHAHPDDEVFEVTSGTMEFNVGGDRRMLRAGDRLVIPAGTMHTFANASKSEGIKGRGEGGLSFERLIDQFAGGGPAFTRLSQQVVTDPAAFRTRKIVYLGMWLVAWIGRLRGIRPLAPDHHLPRA